MSENWEVIIAAMRDIRALQGAGTILGWDDETYLPPNGSEARSEQISVLEGILHEKMTSPKLKEAVLDAVDDSDHPGFNDEEAEAVLEDLKDTIEESERMPVEFVHEMSEAKSKGIRIWREAKAQKNFSLFAPQLERLVQLRRQEAEHIGVSSGQEHYDVLMDKFEEGMTVARMGPVFDGLSQWLSPMVDRLVVDRADDPWAGMTFDVERQRELSIRIMKAMGFDFNSGRLDVSRHPFTAGADSTDVRLTTHFYPGQPLSSVYATMHETGHGLYEQGLPVEHRRDILGLATSLGLHESQSRLWENLVGRSTSFVVGFLHPEMSKVFPQCNISTEQLLKIVNRVRKTLVRIESDEVTYNLHIILRFKLELALLRGQLSVKDLPKAWSDLSHELLGVRPGNDAEGVLQDIHWAWGEFGYFPTYTIGNLYAATLFDAAVREPGMREALDKCDFLPLREWLRVHVHRYGSLRKSEDIVRSVTGKGLTDADFRAYLENKYGRI